MGIRNDSPESERKDGPRYCFRIILIDSSQTEKINRDWQPGPTLYIICRYVRPILLIRFVQFLLQTKRGNQSRQPLLLPHFPLSKCMRKPLKPCMWPRYRRQEMPFPLLQLSPSLQSLWQLQSARFVDAFYPVYLGRGNW